MTNNLNFSISFLTNIKRPLVMPRTPRDRMTLVTAHLNTILESPNFSITDATIIFPKEANTIESKSNSHEAKVSQEAKQSDTLNIIVKVTLVSQDECKRFEEALKSKNLKILDNNNRKPLKGMIGPIIFDKRESLETFFKARGVNAKLTQQFKKFGNIKRYLPSAFVEIPGNDVFNFQKIHLSDFNNHAPLVFRKFQNPNPKTALCRTCGKDFHGDTECKHAEICLKCGGEHNSMEFHGNSYVQIPKCFLCGLTTHTGFRCPRAWPQLVNFKFFEQKQPTPYLAAAFAHSHPQPNIQPLRPMPSSTTSTTATTSSASNVLETKSMPPAGDPRDVIIEELKKKVEDLSKKLEFVQKELSNRITSAITNLEGMIEERMERLNAMIEKIVDRVNTNVDTETKLVNVSDTRSDAMTSNIVSSSTSAISIQSSSSTVNLTSPSSSPVINVVSTSSLSMVSSASTTTIAAPSTNQSARDKRALARGRRRDGVPSTLSSSSNATSTSIISSILTSSSSTSIVSMTTNASTSSSY